MNEKCEHNCGCSDKCEHQWEYKDSVVVHVSGAYPNDTVHAILVCQKCRSVKRVEI